MKFEDAKPRCAFNYGPNPQGKIRENNTMLRKNKSKIFHNDVRQSISKLIWPPWLLLYRMLVCHICFVCPAWWQTPLLLWDNFKFFRTQRKKAEREGCRRSSTCLHPLIELRWFQSRNQERWGTNIIRELSHKALLSSPNQLFPQHLGRRLGSPLDCYH